MKTRTLKRTDLPEKNLGGYSLGIDVIYNGQKRVVADMHFGDNSLCYLEDNNGEPVKITECQLIKSKVNFERIRENEKHQQEIKHWFEEKHNLNR